MSLKFLESGTLAELSCLEWALSFSESESGGRYASRHFGKIFTGISQVQIQNDLYHN